MRHFWGVFLPKSTVDSLVPLVPHGFFSGNQGRPPIGLDAGRIIFEMFAQDLRAHVHEVHQLGAYGDPLIGRGDEQVHLSLPRVDVVPHIVLPGAYLWEVCFATGHMGMLFTETAAFAGQLTPGIKSLAVTAGLDKRLGRP